MRRMISPSAASAQAAWAPIKGAVAYTRQAKILLFGLDEAALCQFRPATEPHALLPAAERAHASPQPGAG
jgi:hypothetical protein